MGTKTHFRVGYFVLLALLLVPTIAFAAKDDYLKLLDNQCSVINCQTTYEVTNANWIYDINKKIDIQLDFYKKNKQSLNGELVSYNFLENYTNSRQEKKYKNVCNTISVNSTNKEVCGLLDDGYNTIYFEDWKPLTDTKLKVGETTKIKITGKRLPNAKIDNIITLKGVGTLGGDYEYDQWVWWNTSFPTCVNINVNVNASLGKQAMPLLLNSSMSTNINTATWGNIRFVNTNCNNGGSEINYELEANNASSALVWLNNSELGITGSKVISMYIGDSGLVSGSNPSKVWVSELVYHMIPVNNSMTKDSFGLKNMTIGINEYLNSTLLPPSINFTKTTAWASYSTTFGTGPFTIKFNFRGKDVTNNNLILTNADSNLDAGAWAFEAYQGSFAFCNAAGCSAHAYPSWGTDSKAFNGQWQEFIVTRDNNNTLRTYWNGTLMKTSTMNYNFNRVGTLLRIGLGAGVVNGEVDDVVIYPSTNLTAEEIYADYKTQQNIRSFNYSAEESIAGITITQSTPIDNYKTNNTLINFSCNISRTGSTLIQNSTLYVYNNSNFLTYTELNKTSGVINQNVTFSNTFTTDGIYNWSCTARGDGNEVSTTGNRTFTLDTQAPTINITAPTQNQIFISNVSIGLNYTLIHNGSLTLGSCWYSLDGVMSSTFTCGLNQTANLTNNNHNLIFYANDSLNNVASSPQTNFSIVNLNYAQSYTTPTMELVSSTFTATIQQNESVTTSAQLFYNNTYYPATDSTTGLLKTFTATINTPAIPYNNYNVSFNWVFNLGNSTTNNQTLQQLSFSSCTGSNASQTLVANFTLKYEQNASYVTEYNGTIQGNFILWINNISNNKSVLFNQGATNNYTLCVSPPNTTFKTTATIQYSMPGYDSRFYFYENATIGSNPSIVEQIDLNLLDITLGTQTIFYTQDQYGNAITGAYVYVLRYYPATNEYKLVSMTKSDLEGKSTTFLRFNDAFYKFLVYKNGALIYESQQTQVTITPGYTYALIYLRVGATLLSTTLNSMNNIQLSNITYNNVTGTCSVTYSNPSGSTITNVCLKGIKRTNINDTFATQCSNSAAGVLSVFLGNRTNAIYSCEVYDVVNGQQKTILTTLIDLRQSIAQTLGKDGPIITFILLFAVVALCLYNPVVAIIGAILALIIALAFGLIWISWGSLIGLIIAGGWIVVKNRN